MRSVKKVLTSLAVTGLLWSVSPLSAQDQWAILIGITEYEHAGEFPDLQFSENDVLALKTSLLDCQFQDDHVIVMTNSMTEARYLPTKENIERELKRVLEGAAEAGDTVIVSFSGHGQNRDGSSYLCPLDASPEAPTDTMISFEQLYLSLARSKASLKLAVIDACRNEVVSGESTRKLSLTQGLRHETVAATGLPEGLMLWASCLDTEVSIEDEALEHGIFVNFIAEGLSGRADFEVAGNRDKQISPYELFSYAHMHTNLHAQKNFASRQQPWQKGEATGNLQLVQLSEEQVAKYGATAPRAMFFQDPEHLHSLDEYAKAVQSFQNGDLESAIRLCSSAIDYDPDPDTNGAAYQMRALAYRLSGDLRNAVADYKQIDRKTQVRVASQRANLQTADGQTGLVQQADLVDITDVTVTQTESGEERVWYWVSSVNRPNATPGTSTSQELTGWIRADSLDTQGTQTDVAQIARRFQKENQLPVSTENTFASYGRQSSSSRAAAAMDVYNRIPYAPSIPYSGLIRGVLGR